MFCVYFYYLFMFCLFCSPRWKRKSIIVHSALSTIRLNASLYFFFCYLCCRTILLSILRSEEYIAILHHTRCIQPIHGAAGDPFSCVKYMHIFSDTVKLSEHFTPCIILPVACYFYLVL